MNSGSTYEGDVMPRDGIHITKHGLKITSGVESYEMFSVNMKANENDFIVPFTT